MQYKDLKEMNIKDWDGKPFKAYCTDDPDCNVDGLTTEILGYVGGLWLSSVRWMHVYPVGWNKEKVEEALKLKRMTNRQLAMWLAKGNGEVTMKEEEAWPVGHHFSYDKINANEPIPASIRVRKWDSEEWVEPTIDLLEGC